MTRISAVVTLVNLGLLVFLLNQVRPVEAHSEASVLRGRALEIVDAQGKVRASITIVPEGPARKPDGSPTEWGNKIFPEAVLFRLIRPDGRPSVKIQTTERGSGFTLGGGLDPAYMVLSAQEGETLLSLTNKDGRRKVVKP
ncbi:MAG TPA: hypothetical protein VF133_07205 [Terriglobales bacterium]